jgi:lipoic acid synthetase
VHRLDGSARELMQRSLGGQPTVCVSANCPNIGECWGRGTATFMIMGDVCTRHCRFCGVPHGKPAPLDPAEPARLAETVADLELSYVVITCVDRDDLIDGGAEHWTGCIRAVRERNPEVGIEVLTGDFRGEESSIATVIRARPDVFAHNVEVVPGLQSVARPSATWQRSLGVLRAARDIAQREHIPLLTKTGLMLGLGESAGEVRDALMEIRESGVDLLTLGQYLRPLNVAGLLDVERYLPPEEFEELSRYARELGFRGVAASPLTRSSHLAETLHAAARSGE